MKLASGTTARSEPLELHKRKPLTKKERIELFREHKGICCICGGKIHVGEPWIDEHGRALALGGSNDWENRGPAHEVCAKVKTKKDVSMIAKAKRIEAKHFLPRPKGKIPSRPFNKPWVDNTKFIGAEHDYDT